jgi:hypothetical protein
LTMLLMKPMINWMPMKETLAICGILTNMYLALWKNRQ